MLLLSAAGREIRKVHTKGISQPQPSTAGRPEAAESGKLGTVSAAMAVGWELIRWELSAWVYLRPVITPFT